MAESSRSVTTRAEQTYADGETIFAEGNPSDAAYVLVDGNVELTKQGPNGQVTLAILRPGEMFGEMGIIDGSNRSASARAMGQVTVKVISGPDFLRTIHDKPDAALSVMGNLIERLRSANDLLVRSTIAREAERADHAPPAAPLATSQERPLGLFDRLFRFAASSRSPRLEVRIAALPGDSDQRHAKHLLAAFESVEGVRARTLRDTIEADPNADVIHQAAQATAAGRQLLIRHRADVLVWGTFDEVGANYVLRFLSRIPESEDRPGWFGNMLRLVLPADFDPTLHVVPAATAIAAIVAESDERAAGLQAILQSALEAIRTVTSESLSSMTSLERASIQACLGNVAAVAAPRGDDTALRDAVARYRAALDVYNREEAPIDWAIVQRNLGLCRQALAERDSDTEHLQVAIESFRHALGVISQDGFPRLWAAIQYRLGQALYRLDLKSDEGGDMIKEAMNAYQSALHVFTRAEAPLRWAEIMNSLAQALQMLGGEARNPDALQKAVDACNAALEVRTREQMPLPWAATQNNLGSALFLLGRITRDPARLGAAAEAFQQAHDLCQQIGAERLATVASRNMAHVDRLLESMTPRSAPKLWWEEEGEDETPPA